MPTAISIRNLDEDLLRRLKRRAARHERSAEAEAREILRAALEREPASDFATLAAQLRTLLAGRPHTAAENLIREGRAER